MPHDVFISYAHDDKVTADAACATLESKGIRCWIAPRDILPGQDYAAAIVHALTHARLFVLVFSARTNTSEHVKNEVEKVVSRGIPVIPFRIEDVIPDGALALHLARRHWLDAMTPPLEQHLNALAQSIALLLSLEVAPATEPEARPTPPLAVAAPASRPPASDPVQPVATPPSVPAPQNPSITIPVAQIKQRLAGLKFTPAMRRAAVLIALVAVLAVGASFGLRACQRHQEETFPPDEVASVTPETPETSSDTPAAATESAHGDEPEPASTQSTTPPPKTTANFKIETWDGKWYTAENLELNNAVSLYGDVLKLGQGQSVETLLLRDIRRASFVFGEEAKGHTFSDQSGSSSVRNYVYVTTKKGKKLEGTWQGVPYSSFYVNNDKGGMESLEPTDLKTLIVK